MPSKKNWICPKLLWLTLYYLAPKQKLSQYENVFFICAKLLSKTNSDINWSIWYYEKKVLIWRSKLYNWQRYIILIVQKWFGPSFVLMWKRENVWICHILAKKVISKEVRIIIAITYLTFWTRSTILSVATTCITITTGRLVCITISFLCWLICITIAIPGKLVSLVITIITGILISLTSGAITSLASLISVTTGSVASLPVSTLNQSCGRDFLGEG